MRNLSRLYYGGSVKLRPILTQAHDDKNPIRSDFGFLLDFDLSPRYRAVAAVRVSDFIGSDFRHTL